MTKQVYLETLGCAKNRVDTEIMMASLKSNGFKLTMKPEKADVIVVNTCAFLTSASEESIERILDLSDYKSTGKCQKLIATGCLSQRYGEELVKEIPELDGILGSNNFQQIPELLARVYDSPLHPQILLQKKPHYTQFEKQERLQTTPKHFAYVKIAEGCSNMCSFCNIPSIRGGFSSRAVTSITEEMLHLLDKGVKEFNLISQDTSSYGKDLKNGTNLTQLVRAISALPGEFWVRLFYAYPNTFSQETIEIMAQDERFCRYLDMPFQHINDQVLKDMNRKISSEKIILKMEEFKRAMPEISWRTTFIVGFPTETEAHFEQLLNFVKEGYFHHVGVFTYSHEDNIRSSKWGDPVPNTVKRERKKLLMEAQQKISAERNAKMVGQTLKVLVDGYAEETELLLQGRSQFQGPEVDGLVYINEGKCRPQQFNLIEITEAHPYDLIGRVA